MLSAAFSLFFLKKFPFERYAFPRWQSALAVTFLGLLLGLDSDRAWSDPELPVMPAWVMSGMAILTIWGVFLVGVVFLRWWLKRGGRWDGNGDLFNLVVASSLVADALCIGLMLLGAPFLLMLPLWLYSLWVCANALSGAIPNVSLGYGIGGIVISQIPVAVIIMLLFAALGFVLALFGYMPPPPPGAGPPGIA